MSGELLDLSSWEACGTCLILVERSSNYSIEGGEQEFSCLSITSPQPSSSTGTDRSLHNVRSNHLLQLTLGPCFKAQVRCCEYLEYSPLRKHICFLPSPSLSRKRLGEVRKHETGTHRDTHTPHTHTRTNKIKTAVERTCIETTDVFWEPQTNALKLMNNLCSRLRCTLQTLVIFVFVFRLLSSVNLNDRPH